MGRWQDNPRGRMAAAAFDLFVTQGYDATSGADIAAAAGLHERSFFRHFPDKRDVLFTNWDEVGEQLHHDAMAFPTESSALDVITGALASRCDFIAQNPDFTRARHRLLAETPVLSERDRTKHDELASTLTDALLRRGTDTPTARLLPQVGMVAFRDAIGQWASTPDSASPRTNLEHNLSILASALN